MVYLKLPSGLGYSACFDREFRQIFDASDALTREPIDRSGPNFAHILSIGWSDCLQNFSQIGLLVRELGRHWNNTQLFLSQLLFQ